MNINRWLRFLATGVALLALTGCGAQVSQTSSTSSDSGCVDKLHGSAPAAPEQLIGVLAGPADDEAKQQAALDTVLDAVLGGPAELILSPVQPGAGGVVKTSLSAEGANQLFRNTNLECKRNQLTEALAVATAPSHSQVDVLGGLRNLASRLSTSGVDGPVEVVVLADMVNRAEPLNLTDAAVVDQGPAALLATVRAAGALPDCTGWRVHAVGPAAGADLEADSVLREFWRLFFKACGGELVLYDTDLLTFPAQATVPAIRRIADSGAITATVPADALFDIGSAAILPRAEAVLAEVVQMIKRSKPSAVMVEGHTDDLPGPNQMLSEARARAVSGWLVSRGIDPGIITTRGYADTRPVAPNDEQGRPKNRRVVVTMEP